MQQALQRGRVRSGDAEPPRRDLRVRAVEPLRREGRRRRSRRRSTPGCWPASRASSSSSSARELGVPMAESTLRDDDLLGADEAFLTSTTREIVPIVRVDDRTGSARAARARHARAARGDSAGTGGLRPATRARSGTVGSAHDAGLLGVRRRSAGRRRTGCGRRTGCRCGRPSARTCSPRTNGSGNAACSPRVRMRPLVVGDHGGRVRRVLEDVVLRSALPVDRPPGSPRGSRSSRRRSDRAPPSPRSRSARSSACPAPGTTRSARGSRSPSAAWRRPSRRCPPRLNGRRSKIISCATRPFVARVEHGVVRLEPRLDVVRVQDRVPSSRRSCRRRRASRCRRTRSAGCSRCPTAPPTPRESPARRRSSTSGWPGRYGARCAATPIGPMPGPPPPCGIANVLCRLRWQTSAPIGAGLVRPDLRVHVGAVHVDLPAVRVDDLADLPDADPRTRRASTDTSPSAPRAVARARAAFARRSSTSTLPCASHATTTTCMPAITALAGLVPCADAGMSTTSRCAVAADAVIGANDEQPGELALRAGVRLQRDGGEAGDLAERRLELAEDLL